MNADAIEQAEERLVSATKALAVLKANGDRRERESAWIDLITALGTVYSKLEQGAKQIDKSRMWFDIKKKERKSDPLLAYIHHARNSAEHGIVRTGRYAIQSVSFTGMKPGATAGLRLTPEGMRPFSTDPDLELRFVENDVSLLTVHDRGVMFHPPTEHLGKTLAEFGASHIGTLAVEYVETMLIEANTLKT